MNKLSWWILLLVGTILLIGLSIQPYHKSGIVINKEIIYPKLLVMRPMIFDTVYSITLLDTIRNIVTTHHISKDRYNTIDIKEYINLNE